MRLVERTLGITAVVRPRPRSLFESPQSVETAARVDPERVAEAPSQGVSGEGPGSGEGIQLRPPGPGAVLPAPARTLSPPLETDLPDATRRAQVPAAAMPERSSPIARSAVTIHDRSPGPFAVPTRRPSLPGGVSPGAVANSRPGTPSIGPGAAASHPHASRPPSGAETAFGLETLRPEARSRDGSRSERPVIDVTIDRIDVHAVVAPPPPSPAPPRPVAPGPRLSLDQYLRGHRRGES